MGRGAGEWTKVGGKTKTVNGTELYHYEFRVGKREAPDEAVRKFTVKLRRQEVEEHNIVGCAGKPRALERLLDEV